MPRSPSQEAKNRLRSPLLGRGVRVLVVDDHPDCMASMAWMLRLWGYEVDTALGGLDALIAARLRQPDVVLLDVSMPRMNGFEVARQLRFMFHDEVTLVAITAHGFDEDRDRCFDAGFDSYLLKPADPLKVAELLRALGKEPCPDRSRF